MDAHQALIRQIAVDVEPGRGPVQQEVDCRQTGAVAHNRFPGIVQTQGSVARAAAIGGNGIQIGQAAETKAAQRALDHIVDGAQTGANGCQLSIESRQVRNDLLGLVGPGVISRCRHAVLVHKLLLN